MAKSKMAELSQTELKRPMDNSQRGQEIGALNALLGMLNNPEITGAAVPENESIKTIPVPVTVPTPTQNFKISTKIFFTGKLKAGKDYVATAAGYTIYGFSDPLNYLASHFSGLQVTSSQNKDVPGMRNFLQTIGQWGRGTLNEQYPFTPARAVFITMIRSLHAAKIIHGYGVDWAKFGLDEDLWLNGLLSRYAADPAPTSAITNVRFENEFKKLQSEGWQHWHVTCSPTTWAKRLAASKMTVDAPQLRDISEKLAVNLDSQVTKQISASRVGPKLRCIWNDPEVPPPSPRLHTLDEFLSAVNAGSRTVEVLTGE